MDRLISAENNQLLWAFCASCFPAKLLVLGICMEIGVPKSVFYCWLFNDSRYLGSKLSIERASGDGRDSFWTEYRQKRNGQLALGDPPRDDVDTCPNNYHVSYMHTSWWASCWGCTRTRGRWCSGGAAAPGPGSRRRAAWAAAARPSPTAASPTSTTATLQQRGLQSLQ